MKKIYTFLFSAIFSTNVFAQDLYFPPLTGNEWEKLDPQELNWCDEKIDELYDYLEEKNTRAFLLLKDGKIVLERYFNGHGQDSLWYWASAGKTVTATLTGIAQEEGLLDINDPTSDYLGTGWTSVPPEKEELITIWNQLTMTSGLDDSGNVFCTDPECLIFLQDAGTRWAYHNGPYTNLSRVVEETSGSNFNLFYWNRLANKTGMGGFWAYVGFNRLLFSKARSMARFGLLIQNNGYWDSTPVLTDSAFIHDMITPSQDLNKSYGYLWWLNGQESYKLPSLQIDFPGFLMPDAPADLYAAAGANGQFLNIVPSRGIVLVRMGESPDGLLVPNLMNNEIWQYVNDLECQPNSIKENTVEEIKVYPNPVSDFLNIELPEKEIDFKCGIFDLLGNKLFEFENKKQVNVDQLNSGIFIYRIKASEKYYNGFFIKSKKD